MASYWSESDDFSAQALRYGRLNSLFQVALYLPSYHPLYMPYNLSHYLRSAHAPGGKLSLYTLQPKYFKCFFGSTTLLDVFGNLEPLFGTLNLLGVFWKPQTFFEVFQKRLRKPQPPRHETANCDERTRAAAWTGQIQKALPRSQLGHPHAKVAAPSPECGRFVWTDRND